MTQSQKYKVLQKIGSIEIREYLPCVMADVVVNCEYEKAGNVGFRPLVSYISQNNIAMTAPVIQEQKGESWIVSFVMPDGSDISKLPIPKNTQVSLREVAAYKAAALTFSGLTSWKKIQAKEKELRNFLEIEQIKTAGPIQIARFDPPWRPGFLRHNEVIFPIKHQ